MDDFNENLNKVEKPVHTVAPGVFPKLLKYWLLLHWFFFC